MSERFVFGPEHVGKQVRHADGKIGVVLDVNPILRAYAVIVDWGTITGSYTIFGSYTNGSEILIYLYEPEATDSQRTEQVPGPILRLPEMPVITASSQSAPAPAPETEYEETPFVPNRAEVWARFMAALIADENIRSIDEAANFSDRALAEYEKRFLNQ